MNGNVVSVDGTFLGRADPTKQGNRYIINLSSVAGEYKDFWLFSQFGDTNPNDLTKDQLIKFYRGFLNHYKAKASDISIDENNDLGVIR